jgi:drug/metabolite transporter (DMT)-like permease
MLLELPKAHLLSTPSAVQFAQAEILAAKRRSMMLVFSCTILGAAAQILMKVGMARFEPHLLSIATNVPLMAGYVLYGINTLMLVLALKEGELSMLYPIIALTYVWVTLLSYALLHEPPNLYKNLGIATIVLGVGVLGRGGRK